MFSYIIDPFKIIGTNKVEFSIWFIFTIFAGQLGIIANVIIRNYSHNLTIPQSIYLDSYNGSFYTFSIALAASALGPLFANFITQKKLKFISLKILTIVFVIFFLIFSGIIYAAVQTTIPIPEALSLSDLAIDWSQLVVYIVAIFIGLYAYCLLKIDSPKFDHLDDKPSYVELDDDNVSDVILESGNVTNDGSGVKL